ncbi:uncharacterized protein F5147DRAFT_689597 [Suillus discolor]|uniref:Glutamine-dependent NAD(+) synthetase n=1 Tax=Suillus discolor TaxID=1912936 RepID=A0A9P7FAS5_9AGAM|nr:uncharacterized protein F5147DRAFT_689597 [Suillus discolor]KAG2110672.1 hypothetical protein F5147DRAFT_689597 [Suillus discolor]
MGHLITLATSLNQWALDFQGNYERIIQSIAIAKERGATLRVGPELEIPGYGCYDHFLEGDTILHSWEVLAKILAGDDTMGIICDIGMPVVHKNVIYNCRVIVHDRQILLIRPKMWLANDGNYREMRYFTPWMKYQQWEDHFLPRIIQTVTKQVCHCFPSTSVTHNSSFPGQSPFWRLYYKHGGHLYRLGAIMSYENFTPASSYMDSLGGVYLYANQKGCDGDRLYYDGCAMIAMNGHIVSQGSQFSLDDVEVVTATIDIEDVRSHRTSRSRGLQAARSKAFHRIEVPFALSSGKFGDTDGAMALGIQAKLAGARFHTPEEEIALGPACWLWDYLRRSRTQGYFVPLSGGIDSCATAVIVYSMCRLVAEAARKGDKQVILDARRMVGEPEDSVYTPLDPHEFCNKIFHTCYMGTENSSAETRKRAKDLSAAIGSYHVDLNMDTLVTSVRDLFAFVTGMRPQFRAHGGSGAENLALQNIQARLRMLLAYLFAQLLPWVRGRQGALLVLGKMPTELTLIPADINPIGSISKTDLKKFIAYAGDAFEIPILNDFLTAVPTAELEPISETYVQADEADMGMTYDELSVFGRFRKVEKCGPYGMFTKLVHEWGSFLSPVQIAEKVKHFFFEYARNRHKMTTLTPAYHAESYSPDDNRFDLRPFLYPSRFPWQFKKIDEVAAILPDRSNPAADKTKTD